MRLQRWWRRGRLRAAWLTAVSEVVEYHRLVRQLKRTRAATRLQRWSRRSALRRRWLALVSDVCDYYRLMRELRRTRASVVVEKHARRYLATAEARRRWSARVEQEELSREFDR